MIMDTFMKERYCERQTPLELKNLQVYSLGGATVIRFSNDCQSGGKLLLINHSVNSVN